MTYGERLKQIRKGTGLSQQEFAESIGVSRSPIAFAESGKSKLQPLAVHRICELYDINENWLLTGEGNMRTVYDIPSEELKNLLEIYSKLPEISRKKFVSFLQDLVEQEN